MGPERRKDKCSYPIPQAEVEDNVDHGARQRGTRHEEDARRTYNYADAEKRVSGSNGASGSNGTSPGASSRGHCTGRVSQNIYGTNPGRMWKVGHQRDCSAGIGRTQGEYHAGPNASNGSQGEVPYYHKGDRRSTQGLDGSGRATCQCWGTFGSRPKRKEWLFWEGGHA
jgi:hypothetical protein